jgi:hypothetical protein
MCGGGPSYSTVVPNQGVARDACSRYRAGCVAALNVSTSGGLAAFNQAAFSCKRFSLTKKSFLRAMRV